MLHLYTLMRQTPNNIVRNAGKVRLLKGSAHIEKDDRGEHKVFVATLKTQEPGKKQRHATIKLYGSRKAGGAMRKGPKHPCWVHCDCEYFLYYLEVSIAARGSSNVITSNGNFPKIRNPRMRPYLCKHLLEAARHAPKSKPKDARRPTDITDIEIEEMVALMQPFLPGEPRKPAKKMAPTAKRKLPRRISGPGSRV
jgi:hypothetical protein